VRIFVSAPDPSGERHAAALVREFRRRAIDATWVGLGTEMLEQEGVRILVDARRFAVMGLTRIPPLIPEAFRALARISAWIRRERPDLVVLVDAPGLHGFLGELAARHDVPVVSYVCPQLWAWGPWRAPYLRRRLRLLLGFFAFERPWFARHDIPVEVVGHPLFDHLAASKLDETAVARWRGEEDAPLVALLPGSRRQEIETNLPVLVNAARRLRERHPEIRFAASARVEAFREPVARVLDRIGVTADIVVGGFHELLAAARLGLITSGSATLEGAWFELPMVVTYRTSPFALRLVDRLTTMPYIASVNLLGREEVVPEFLVSEEDRPDVAEAAERLLVDGKERALCLERLRRLRAQAARPGATARAVDRLLALAREHR